MKLKKVHSVLSDIDESRYDKENDNCVKKKFLVLEPYEEHYWVVL